MSIIIIGTKMKSEKENKQNMFLERICGFPIGIKDDCPFFLSMSHIPKKQ